MQKKKKMHRFSKAVGLFCAIVMLVCALYVPMALSASAIASVEITDNTPVVFDFEDTVYDGAANKAEAEANGAGYYGWSQTIKTYTEGEVTNKVLRNDKTSAQSWSTSGGYRLHAKRADGTYGFYELAPSSKYMISLKVRVLSSPTSNGITGSKDTNKAYVSLGYNGFFNASDANQSTSYVNNVSSRPVAIVESLIDSNTFTLYDFDGNSTVYECGDTWYTATYFLDTPAEFTKDPALALWATSFYGWACEIDDVTVTKIGEGMGRVVLVDEYAGKKEAFIGKVGDAFTLPDIADRATEDTHIFEGWYTTADRDVKAENVTFAAEDTVFYSRWKAPVTITFKDNLNKTEKTITGSAGDPITYPADPVNPDGTSWFMGWYTDETYTKEYTSGKFSYSNIILYAYFMGEVAGFEQDFEDYNKDAWTEMNVTNNNGTTDNTSDDYIAVYKSNYLYFYTTLSKQSDVVNGGNYAVKFHWNTDPALNKDVSKADGQNIKNPDSYEQSRYSAMDNYFYIGKGLQNETKYNITFKYKVEQGDQNVQFYLLSAAENNGWANRSYYGDSVNVTLKPGDWQEHTISFTTNMKSVKDAIFLGVKLSENKDVIMYFDDIKVEAFAQPYESVATIYTGINDEVISLKGNRGDEIDIPTLTHPMEAEFMGWFLDEEFTTPATELVYVRGEIKLYAKWVGYSGFTQDFENYTRDTKTPQTYTHTNNNGTTDDTSDDYTYPKVYYSNYLDFYTTMSKQSDVVYGGEYAVKFHWNTDPALNKDVSKADGQNIMNPDSYEQSRYSAMDNYFNIGKGLENNQIYTVTFKYKVEKGNQNVQFYVLTGTGGNSWGNRVQYMAPQTVDIKPGDWQEYSFEFTTAMKSASDHIYLGVKLSENKDVIMYFDDVLVKSVPNTEQVVMLVNTGYSSTPEKVIAQKGSELVLPTLDHPDNAPFLGWYSDAAFTTPFTATVYPKTNFAIYAKWGPYAMTFKTYPYEGHAYSDQYINRETAPGLGNGDDYAMHWKLKREKDNDTGVGTSQAFLIYKGIENGKAYRVKYDYKVNSSNISGSIDVRGYDSANIWWSGVMYKYNSVKVSAGQKTGWETNEFYMSANVIEANGYQKSDDLFIYFSFNGTGAAGTNMDILIDNVYIEEVEAPYVFFDGQNGKEGTVVRGKVGDTIELPENPTKIGYSFAGWYMDRECTVKCDLKTFEADTAVVAYAKWNESDSATYSFENYTLIPDDGGWDFVDGEVVKRNAKSGSYSMYFGNRTPGNYNSRSCFAIEDSGEFYQLEKSRQYIITVNYYVKEYGSAPFNISFITSSHGNIYVALNKNTGTIGVNQPITVAEAALNKGKWVKKTFAVDTTVLTENGAEHTQLFALISGGENWEVYFDDITITKVPKGKSVVAFDTMGTKGCPDYVIGNVGTDYSAKVPENLTLGDMSFKGYYTMSADGAWLEKERSAMKFGEKAEVVFGRFLDRYVTENFDTGFYDKASGGGVGYTLHDFDYEVYDSEKEGNSKDNVTSGRYSLHRKGNSMYKENSVILTLGNQIAEGERYTVTFKVKMGKHFHTDGAVKIVSGRSFEYAWTTTGDYYPVVPVADLTDGQWHEVSYTFNSVESFLVVQTPGYVELFMDDFEFKLVDESVPLSEPPVYTEYVAAERDANGNLVRPDRTAVDISSIIDDSLSGGSFPWLWVIIGVAAVLVIAGGVVAFVLIKKKKSKA